MQNSSVGNNEQNLFQEVAALRKRLADLERSLFTYSREPAHSKPGEEKDKPEDYGIDIIAGMFGLQTYSRHDGMSVSGSNDIRCLVCHDSPALPLMLQFY